MSFKINWDHIEKKNLSTTTIELLEEVLNSGKRPSILSSDIKIIDLSFGEIAPDFEILEIGDLANDKFRGIFKFKYYGDASITVNTKVSASPLKNYSDTFSDTILDENNVNYKNMSYELNDLTGFIKPEFNLSDCDFDIPLNLTLSKFKLSSIIVVVFSKTKGLTLVFKNDPLESIEVSSTFDRIKPIAEFLQKKIEAQISDLFKELLPSILYKFSLKYTTQSFDQFHKDLLLNEELDSDEKKRVSLKDIDPENPLRISPGNLMRLTRLSSSRQTLTFGGRLSCDTMNKEIVTKSFVNAIIASNLNNFSLNKIQLSKSDFQYGSISTKVSAIKEFQTRNYIKNNHNSHDNLKPKRRVIKMKHKKSKKHTETDTESIVTAVPTSPILSASPPNIQSTPVQKSESITSSTTLVDDLSVDPHNNLVALDHVITKSADGKTSSKNSKSSQKTKQHSEHKTRKSSTSSSSSSSHIKSTPPQFTEKIKRIGSPIYIPIQLVPQKTSRTTRASLPSGKVYHIDKDEELMIHSRRMKLEKLVNPQAVSQQMSHGSGSTGNLYNPFLETIAPPPPYSF
ncbi:unnamed protein product [Ambrosiozyma monospora]|uniref:Mitochondrial distribution and morphology protein 34 n=1 Tax=Ambrosiozyma monospora TaxID=43982 RepID=A0A9W6YZE8_AMBMO|nr:unnamed protein product [Ambrosiozyma monospora]